MLTEPMTATVWSICVFVVGVVTFRNRSEPERWGEAACDQVPPIVLFGPGVPAMLGIGTACAMAMGSLGVVVCLIRALAG